MKKLLSLTLILVMLLSLTACFDKNTDRDKKDNRSDSKMQTGTVEKIEFEKDNASVEYLRHELKKDFLKRDIVIIDFSFENKLKEDKCLRDAVAIEVFQGEHELVALTLNKDEYPSNGFTKYPKGADLCCSVGYMLKSKEDLRLVVYPKKGNVYESAVFQEQILKLQ